jgi:hypothetical protein
MQPVHVGDDPLERLGGDAERGAERLVAQKQGGGVSVTVCGKSRCDGHIPAEL